MVSQYDSIQPVETPEGVDLALSPAGPCPRGLAWMIDASIRWCGYIAFSMLLAFFGDAGGGLFLVVMFLGEWFYPVVFEVYRDGQTPGKSIIGLAVVAQDGTPVGFAPSVIRNLLAFADFLPLFYLTGLVSSLLTERFQRLGDLAAGTQVVHRPERRKKKSEERSWRALPRPLPIPLRLSEQRAVLDFADRRDGLNPDRAEELARLAKPLVGEADQAADVLSAFALWLEGRRPKPSEGSG